MRAARVDGGFFPNMDELLRNLQSAEVITIYFPILRKTLLIDTRTSVEDDPMVKIVPMATSLEERVRTIRRLRPQFPRPEAISFLPWPRFIGGLERLGIWQHIADRFVASGDTQTLRELKQALEELQKLEQQELAAVISGENYHTLWSRSGGSQET